MSVLYHTIRHMPALFSTAYGSPISTMCHNLWAQKI